MGILGDTVSRRGGAGREDGRFGASAWASARTVRRARDVMGEVKRAREHSLCEQPHEGVICCCGVGERLTDETKPFSDFTSLKLDFTDSRLETRSMIHRTRRHVAGWRGSVS